MRLLKPRVLWQFGRYVAVGLFVTVINYAIFVTVIACSIHYLAAATISSAVAALASYMLNRGFTFMAPGRANPREFGSFSGIVLLQYLFGLASYALLMGYLGLGATIFFVINSAIVAVGTFILLRNTTFRSAQDGPGS